MFQFSQLKFRIFSVSTRERFERTTNIDYSLGYTLWRIENKKYPFLILYYLGMRVSNLPDKLLSFIIIDISIRAYLIFYEDIHIPVDVKLITLATSVSYLFYAKEPCSGNNNT